MDCQDARAQFPDRLTGARNPATGRAPEPVLGPWSGPTSGPASEAASEQASEPASEQALRAHLESCPACARELADLASTWDLLDEIPAATPDAAAMRVRFDELVERHAPRRRWWMTPGLQAAAAVVLLGIGTAIGMTIGRAAPAPAAVDGSVAELRDELRSMRQMVTLALLQQQSASERLKGVTWTASLEEPGAEVVTALVDAVQHDPNVNVRLASIDALKRFAERDAVRSAVIGALDSQTSPLVQIALIDFMVETNERRAVGALERLSMDADINRTVRERASWGLQQIG